MIKVLDSNNQNDLVRVNDFLNDCSYAEYYQTYNWSLIRNEKIKYYLYSEDSLKNINWVCSLFEKTIDGNLILYAPRGPVLDYANENNIKCFLKEIKEWMSVIGYYKIIVNPVIDYDFFQGLQTKIKYEITKSNDYRKLFDSCKLAIMDVIFDEEELISKLPSKFRQNIRRSYRKGLTYKTTKNIDLDNFYDLYLQTAERHDFKPHTKLYFEKILEVFRNDIVCFEVWYEEQPLAMSIDFVYKDKLIYLYGVSSSSNRNLLGMYSMQWEAIKYCIANKIAKYDFGGVFCEENDFENKDYGLYTFKRGFCYKGFTDILPDIKLNFNNNQEGK